MTLHDLSLSRLYNQQVLATAYKTPREIVSWMGAMQAQDYAMVKWAIGIRLPGIKNSTIQQAIDKGEIIRTHVLRPTWHFVSAKDAGWLLDLTAPHIKGSLKSRHRELELSAAILKKSIRTIERSLDNGEHLTREELVNHLSKNNISTHDQRVAHILLMAELDKIICSGAMRGKKNTYALFADRIVNSQKLTREEALQKLATQYFKSHGPATIRDFIWWSGLPVADAKRGMDMIKDSFHSAKIEGHTYWYEQRANPENGDKVYLLPAFDEFVISYKDRTACLTLQNHSATISSNGIFRPVIVFNGQVMGLWKRTTVKNKIIVETKLFSSGTKQENKKMLKRIMEASAKVVDFFDPLDV